MTNALLTEKRKEFHRNLIIKEVLSFSPATNDIRNKFGFEEVVSNADAGQKSSIRIANALANEVSLNAEIPIRFLSKKAPGQTLGDIFEELCRQYLEDTFPQLDHLRPGQWQIRKVGSRDSSVLGSFEQYSHLAELERLASQHDELRTFLGEGYTIAPDVIISRSPENDENINIAGLIVDDDTCTGSALREKNHAWPPKQLLHASLSCKFTMRSDRSQNSRTEALNLLRGRKGRAPHIVAITAEPTPSRIASLALGTGDMDCVYHFALYELRKVLSLQNDESALDLLEVMIEGKRLKDISDLPLDLAV